MQTTEFVLKDQALPFLRLEGSATAKVGDLIPSGGKTYRVVGRNVSANGRHTLTKLTLIENVQ